MRALLAMLAVPRLSLSHVITLCSLLSALSSQWCLHLGQASFHREPWADPFLLYGEIAIPFMTLLLIIPQCIISIRSGGHTPKPGAFYPELLALFTSSPSHPANELSAARRMFMALDLISRPRYSTSGLLAVFGILQYVASSILHKVIISAWHGLDWALPFLNRAALATWLIFAFTLTLHLTLRHLKARYNSKAAP